MDLRELYQAVIIDHNRYPKHRHTMSDATHQAKGLNALCGDELTLYLRIENDVIQAASFVGSGCAIATASVSLLTENVIGKTVAESEALFSHFHHLMTSDVYFASSPDLGKLTVFSGVKEFPARVKCATLAWHTLHAALQQQVQPISTE